MTVKQSGKLYSFHIYPNLFNYFYKILKISRDDSRIPSSDLELMIIKSSGNTLSNKKMNFPIPGVFDSSGNIHVHRLNESFR